MTHVAVTAATGSSRKARNGDWAESYVPRLVVTDLLVISIAVCVAFVVGHVSRVRGGLPEIAGIPPSLLACVALVAVWMAGLAASGSRARRIVGAGVTEYRRVAHVSFVVVGLAGLAAYVLDVDGLQGFLAALLPLGLVLLVFDRWLWRKWLAHRRRIGEMSSRVLLVGSPASCARVAADLARSPSSGFLVVGSCTPDELDPGWSPADSVGADPGASDAVIAALEAARADTVVLTSAEGLPPERVRALGWRLEPGRHHLVLVPGLTDIGGPRLHTRPVAGLPLIHVETPRFDGGRLSAKRAFDVVVSASLIALLAPVLVAIAVLVKTSSPGPVIFRQRRVGLRGEGFEMLKFRSMYADAEQRLADLVALDRDAGNGVLFKMRDDPRVTPIGRFLRRSSLDELPQLFNVLAGSMSLVGPRPPLEREVRQYERHVHRRFLVKPGITGLWQVSGRSNLDWEESVRLDLYYVENWTITGDLMILWRTARAVLGSDGAY